MNRETRWLWLLVVLTLVPFAILAYWARFYAPAAWEPGVLAALSPAGTLSHLVSDAINTLGNPPLWIVVVVVGGVVMKTLRGTAAALAVVLTYASDFVAFGVKLIVERPRPESALQFFGPDDFSYPSGHVVRAVSFVALVVWLLAPPPLRLPLTLIGGVLAWLLMGYARVSMGVHWPTDTFGGFLLGLAWFAASALVLIRRGRLAVN